MTTPLDPLQLRLDLQIPEGEFVAVRVSEQDIGAQLLPILSKGLYTDPLHCVREYVQNSVDAGATEVRIKITANSVLIHDNGAGMNAAELIQARQFGVSLKDVRSSVGFRGIGVYSGFDLCNRLNITTKKAGQDKSYVLEFDFGAMKQVLQEATDSGRPAVSLSRLLEEYSRFSQEGADRAQHYTIVQLEDISSFHIAELSNRPQLRKYILRNLPIEFDPAFRHRADINEAIATYLPSYHAVSVIIESDNQPTERVVKPVIPDLDKPKTGPIVNSKNEQIAFYWACLRKPETGTRGRIPDEYSDYRGFLYKMRGFTIGDNTKLQRHFKRGNSGLYFWYTGEIYVTDPDVLPNTERNDFESGPAQQVLEKAVVAKLKELEKHAAEYQEHGRALDKFTEANEWIANTWQRVNTGTFPALELLLKASELCSDIEDQKHRLEKTKQVWGKEIIESFEQLIQFLQKEIEAPKGTAEKRREAAKRRDEQQESPPASESPPAVETAAAETGDGAPAVQSLGQIIQSTGWALGEECSRLIEIIDQSLGDVLDSGSPRHRDLLADIEAKLTSELAG
jgi:hypothetical protein